MRWKSLLDGHREPAKTSVELKKQLDEAKSILPHLFGVPYEECVHLLQNDTNLSSPQQPALQSGTKTRSVNELLEFKDTLNVPDWRWDYVCDFFYLAAGTTIHYIRKVRTALNENMKPLKVRT